MDTEGLLRGAGIIIPDYCVRCGQRPASFCTTYSYWKDKAGHIHRSGAEWVLCADCKRGEDEGPGSETALKAVEEGPTPPLDTPGYECHYLCRDKPRGFRDF